MDTPHPPFLGVAKQRDSLCTCLPSAPTTARPTASTLEARWGPWRAPAATTPPAPAARSSRRMPRSAPRASCATARSRGVSAGGAGPGCCTPAGAVHRPLMLPLHTRWLSRLLCRCCCLSPSPCPSRPYCPSFAPAAAVHEPLEPEYSILKQRIARRLRHEGNTDESVKSLSLGGWASQHWSGRGGVGRGGLSPGGALGRQPAWHSRIRAPTPLAAPCVLPPTTHTHTCSRHDQGG